MKTKILQTAILALWGICIFLGMGIILVHQYTPAAPLAGVSQTVLIQNALSQWPAGELREQVLDAEADFTLVVLAHPQCPCTHATLRELERLAPHTAGKLCLRALFAVSDGGVDLTQNSANLTLARAIPGLKVELVPGGQIVHRFGASTSGHVLVFDRKGQLRFEGGITAGRGHEGTNPGAESVRTLARTGTTRLATTPVFGCSLETPGAEIKSSTLTARTESPRALGGGL